MANQDFAGVKRRAAEPVPNYKEFYEGRWFSAATTAHSRQVRLGGEDVPFGTHFLFDATDVEGLLVGVEICEDLWVPMPPSCSQAVNGATVLLNLSASNEVIGKAGYRRQLVLNQSGHCMAAYVYTSCGVWESTTDVVFGGHCLIAEDGKVMQYTEGSIEPYELHDFFLFHFMRYGADPAKILFLAHQATFSRPYPGDEVKGWLKVFLRRFFTHQFKCSCLPDGPKVGSVSPRGDWRMPSDAQAALWLASLEEGAPAPIATAPPGRRGN